MRTYSQRLKKAREDADRATQEWGRRHYNRCEGCDAWGIDCLHHFITKGSCAALRYEPINLIPICKKCHYKIHKNNDARIVLKIRKVRGGDKWEKELWRLARAIVKPSLSYYKEIKKAFENDQFQQH